MEHGFDVSLGVLGDQSSALGIAWLQGVAAGDGVLIACLEFSSQGSKLVSGIRRVNYGSYRLLVLEPLP